MAYSNQQIIDAYNVHSANGMSDNDFVNWANSLGVSGDQLVAAKNEMASSAPAPIQSSPAPAPAPDFYNPQWVESAKQWSNGRSGSEVLAKAQELGLTADQVGNVFGFSGADLSKATGYGTGTTQAVAADGTSLSNWMYDASKGWTLNQPKKPTVQGSGGSTYGDMGVSDRSANQNIFAYDQQNPYMAQMAQTIGRQINDNVQRNIMPGVRSGAQQVGGYGGSRQGVVEANVYNDANKQFADAITGMYYGDYSNQLGRQLDKYKTDTGYDLGIGQLALGNKQANNSYSLGLGQLNLGRDTLAQNLGIAQMQNDTTRYGLDTNSATQRYGIDTNAATSRYASDKSAEVGLTNASAAFQNANNNYNLGMTQANNSFFTNNRQLDLQGLQIGANLINAANQGFMGQGSGMQSIGDAYQQAPWASMGNFTGVSSPYTGFGSTSSNSSGNPWASALGGALGGAQLYNNFSGGSNMLNGNGFSNLPAMYAVG